MSSSSLYSTQNPIPFPITPAQRLPHTKKLSLLNLAEAAIEASISAAASESTPGSRASGTTSSGITSTSDLHHIRSSIQSQLASSKKRDENLIFELLDEYLYELWDLKQKEGLIRKQVPEFLWRSGFLLKEQDSTSSNSLFKNLTHKRKNEYVSGNQLDLEFIMILWTEVWLLVSMKCSALRESGAHYHVLQQQQQQQQQQHNHHNSSSSSRSEGVAGAPVSSSSPPPSAAAEDSSGLSRSSSNSSLYHPQHLAYSEQVGVAPEQLLTPTTRRENSNHTITISGSMTTEESYHTATATEGSVNSVTNTAAGHADKAPPTATPNPSPPAHPAVQQCAESLSKVLSILNFLQERIEKHSSLEYFKMLPEMHIEAVVMMQAFCKGMLEMLLLKIEVERDLYWSAHEREDPVHQHQQSSSGGVGSEHSSHSHSHQPGTDAPADVSSCPPPSHNRNHHPLTAKETGDRCMRIAHLFDQSQKNMTRLSHHMESVYHVHTDEKLTHTILQYRIYFRYLALVYYAIDRHEAEQIGDACILSLTAHRQLQELKILLSKNVHSGNSSILSKSEFSDHLYEIEQLTCRYRRENVLIHREKIRPLKELGIKVLKQNQPLYVIPKFRVDELGSYMKKIQAKQQQKKQQTISSVV